MANTHKATLLSETGNLIKIHTNRYVLFKVNYRYCSLISTIFRWRHFEGTICVKVCFDIGY